MHDFLQFQQLMECTKHAIKANIDMIVETRQTK